MSNEAQKTSVLAALSRILASVEVDDRRKADAAGSCPVRDIRSNRFYLHHRYLQG
jgi:predicted exporter